MGLSHLKWLAKLRTLNLGTTKVSDAGLERLKSLNSLESLRLSGTTHSPTGALRPRGQRRRQDQDRAAERLAPDSLSRVRLARHAAFLQAPLRTRNLD